MMKLKNSPFLRHFTVISFVSVIILNISVMEFGFDNSVFSLIQAMDVFDDDFGMFQGKSRHKLDPVKLSLLGSLGTPFRAVFMIAALFVGERYGRWPVFVMMQVGSMAGTAIMLTARSFVAMVVGRIVLTIFAGWHDWLIPMYLAEIVPGPVRGIVIASYMGFNYFGSFIAALSSFLCNHAFQDARQYHIPISLMFVAPVVCLSLCWIMPESPRWLVRRGRMADAAHSLRRLNGSKADYDPEEEARLLKQSVDADEETKGRFTDILQGNNRRRALTTLVCILMVYLTGQAFVTKYGTIFVKGLNAMDPMEFGVLERGLGILGPIILSLTIDRFGRRPVLFTCGSLYTACLVIIAGIGTMNMHRVKDAIVALYIVAAILHIISFHGVCTIVSAEVPHLRLRDKVLTLAYVASFVIEFGVSFSLPYLLYAPYANLESKVGFIYGGVALLGLIWAYFNLPETSGRTLEEMEELWDQNVPPRKWSSYELQSDLAKRIHSIEGHAGAADGSSSDEDLGRRARDSKMVDDEDVGIVVYHETVEPKK